MNSIRGECRVGGRRIFRILGAIPLILLVSLAKAAPFDCHTGTCGLHGDGPFSKLVVGKVTRVADDAEARAVFDWARTNGFWADLDADPRRFVDNIQMMSIQIPAEQGSREITLLMGREHYEAISILAGDLVRYIPHEADSATPESGNHEADPYWKLFGCIAVLCRAEDLICLSRYAPGVYRLNDGVRLSEDLRTPLFSATRVDPLTYLPMQAEKAVSAPILKN